MFTGVVVNQQQLIDVDTITIVLAVAPSDGWEFGMVRVIILNWILN